jgi:hypothetical protein
MLASESPSVSLAQGMGVASWLWFLVWGISAALIAVSGASIVSGERTRQTLPVLISTPLPGDEIVRELFAGVRRLITVLWIPFGTIAFYQYWFQLGATSFGPVSNGERLICALLQVTVYPFLIGWGAFYVGTRVRSGLWAVLGSLLALLTVILVPFAAVMLMMWFNSSAGLAGVLLMASPATIVVINETRGVAVLYSIANFAVFGALTVFIRAHCLRRADRLLGRTAPPVGTRSQASRKAREFSLPRAPHRRPETSPQLSETPG